MMHGQKNNKLYLQVSKCVFPASVLYALL